MGAGGSRGGGRTGLVAGSSSSELFFTLPKGSFSYCGSNVVLSPTDNTQQMEDQTQKLLEDFGVEERIILKWS